MTKIKRFICDTNVLLSSLISKNSPPSLTIDFIKRNGFFVFSQSTFLELEEVLQRPKFDKFISKDLRLNFINEISRLAITYNVIEQVELCRDPKDNKFLDISIASNADFLITGDEDLLVLKKIENTIIITPRNFISLL